MDVLDDKGTIFNEYPDEIIHEGKTGTIRFHKDNFKSVVIDADYGD